MDLVDSHCHIHEAGQSHVGRNPTRALWTKLGLTAEAVLNRAKEAGVSRLICVGTTLEDSKLAIQFVTWRDAASASIGLHPHEALDYAHHLAKLEEFAGLATAHKVVAVGECGLDYFYGHSPKADQEVVLRFQIELALEHNLPLIFHVREAFDDFWPIVDSYEGIRGVVHSFSAGKKELDQILERGLYVGLNGIMTFTKEDGQLAAAKAVPLNRLLLETDAPFLTPEPFRGKVCEPKHVRQTAQFLAELRGESLNKLAEATTSNAEELFGL